MELNTITESLEKINSKKISILELNDIFINRVNHRHNIFFFFFMKIQ